MEKKCDIVVLSYESPELLKKCIESVLEFTFVPSKLIIVDNASKDPEVAKYLHSVQGNDKVTIERVLSNTNAGFAGGMNKGIKLSTAPYICILNNDCIVTPGWLKEMISVAETREDVGLVNPQSNTFGSNPDEGASMRDHAELLSDKEGKIVELGHAIGFACLIKRQVIDSIGMLGEEYEGVCYEDTDFSLRAYKAGFVSVMSERAYVYHLEQASRKSLKDKEKIYARNKKIFEDRWGRLLRILCIEHKRSASKLFKAYEALKPLARERAIVDMWVITPFTSDEIYKYMEKENIVKHADVGIRPLRKSFLAVKVLWKVLTKKKKYDAVVLEDKFLARILSIFKPIHRAEVLIKRSDGELYSEKLVFNLDKPFALTKYLRET